MKSHFDALDISSTPNSSEIRFEVFIEHKYAAAVGRKFTTQHNANLKLERIPRENKLVVAAAQNCCP
jgi:hypothetical protein